MADNQAPRAEGEQQQQAINRRPYTSSLCGSMSAEPMWCMYGCFLPCCALVSLRQNVLVPKELFSEKYTCCQDTCLSCPSFCAGTQKSCACCCLLTESFLCPQYSLRGSRWQYQNDNLVAMDSCEDTILFSKQLCNTLLCPIDCPIATFYGKDYNFQTGGPIGMLIGLLLFDPVMLSCVGCAIAQVMADVKKK